MSNQNEIDYEKQFLDDLAKATALSLEQQALDEYNRSKKYEKARSYYEYDGGNISGRSQDEVMSQYYAQLRQRQYARSNSNNNSGATETASGLPYVLPSVLKRSNSQTPNTTTLTGTAGATASGATSALTESDLINFNSPTSQKPAEQQTFEKLIEDLQKLQTSTPPNTQLALVSSAVPPYQQQQQHHHHHQKQIPIASNHYPYVPVANYAGGMQLVPFQASANNTQATKTPLTNEQLQKLYNMPYGVNYGPAGHQPQTPPVPVAALPPPSYGTVMGFVTPPAATSAAYMPPQYPGYGSYNFIKTVSHTAPIPSQPPPQQPSSSSSSSYNMQIATTTTTSANPTIAIHSNVPSVNSSAVSSTHSNSNNNITNSNATNGYNNSTSSAGLPAVRRPSRASAGNDLIDLNQDDDSRVSVLEAFDPLLNEEDTVLRKKFTSW